MRDMHPTQPDPSDPDRDSDPFDPRRFGKISFTTTFFKRLITTSLPEPKAEDLVDSIPPGEGPDGAEVHQAASLYRGARRSEERAAPGAFGTPSSALDQTLEKQFFLSPEEAQVLRRGPSRRHGLWAAIVVGGAAGALATVLWAAMDGQTPVGQEQTQQSTGPLSSTKVPRSSQDTSRAPFDLAARPPHAPPPPADVSPSSGFAQTAPPTKPLLAAGSVPPHTPADSSAAAKAHATPPSARASAPVVTTLRKAAPKAQGSARLRDPGSAVEPIRREPSAPKASGHSPFEPR